MERRPDGTVRLLIKATLRSRPGVWRLATPMVVVLDRWLVRRYLAAMRRLALSATWPRSPRSAH